MSDNTPGGDPGGEGSPMISRVPWATDAESTSSPVTPLAAEHDGRGTDGRGTDDRAHDRAQPDPEPDDEGTIRVTRAVPRPQGSDAGPTPAAGPGSAPAPPGRPGGPAPTSGATPPRPSTPPQTLHTPQASRPAPMSTPVPQRAPGSASSAPGSGRQQPVGSGHSRPGADGPPAGAGRPVPTSAAAPAGGYAPPRQSGPHQPAPQQPGPQQPGPQQPDQQQPGPQQTGPDQPGATDRPAAGLEGVSVPQPSRPAEQQQYPPRYGVNDLIQQLNPETQQKSKKGWRARLGLKPSQREMAELRDDESVRMPFARPVTIMVANPKGGVGKTPTTLMLAAAMGVARGGGVIAWDNNELRGTMPDRSLSPHRRTVRDMLAESAFLSQPTAQFTDLSYYFNHQTTGKFHTLGSAQTSGHVISRHDFETIHNIMSRFFQVIIVDTGNNEASPNWQAAAEEADCLVVPTKWRKDSLIPAARMLETLQELNSDLLNRTVVVATNGPSDSQQSVRLSGAEFFGSYPIVEIPTDPHVAEGGVIDYLKLQDNTRRAALVLAAEVARAIEPVAGPSQASGRNAPPRRSIG